MSKRTYRATSVNKVVVENIEKQLLRGERLIVAVDVAKTDNKAALLQGERVVMTVGWKAPAENRQWFDLVARLHAISPVELVMESTGTYGDPLRGEMERRGIAVYRVSGKHASDAAELFDGVPSMHDVKAAHLLGWLHLRGRSRRWAIKAEEERDLAAASELYCMHNDLFMACLGRLEAKVARHFPELTSVVDLENASTLEVLAKFGDPRQIAAQSATTRELMRRVGGPLLALEKIDAVILAARTTTGLPMSAGERASLMHLAAEANRQRVLKGEAKKSLEVHVDKCAPMKRTAEVVGPATAAVLFSEAGDPGAYAAPAAYVKALGLNLKERSSGQHQGQLKITKRGSPTARKLLFMAVLRAVKTEPLFKAWYERKVERDGGKRKLKALTALMRKLASSLWHVARGAPFDPNKLLDARRLGMAA